MASTFMSNWAPLWRMNTGEAVPFGAKTVRNILDKTNIHAPEVISSWWQNTFAAGFSDNFFRMAVFSLVFQLAGFIPHLMGAEKHYFSMGTSLSAWTPIHTLYMLELRPPMQSCQDYSVCLYLHHLIIRYYLFITFFFAYCTTFLFPTGPLNIILGCLFTWLSASNWGIRHLLVNACAIIWAIRLGRFLVDRANRFGTGRKMRAVKSRPLAKLSFWLGQWAWVMVCLAPIVALNSTPSTSPIFNRAYWTALPSVWSTLRSGNWSNFTNWGRFLFRTLTANAPGRFALSSLNWRDALGLLGMWLPGFIIETVADRQKTRFRASRNKHAPFPHHGLWGLVRHPNYLGELLMWSGLTLSASNSFSGWSKLAAFCPAVVFLILSKISGVPLQEFSMKKQIAAASDLESMDGHAEGSGSGSQISFKNMYQRYLDTTKSIIPFLY